MTERQWDQLLELLGTILVFGLFFALAAMA